MSATGCFPGRCEARRDNPRRSTCLRLIACPSNGIPRSTVRSITPAVQRVYRTLSQGCFERLEPDIRKPICPVLRGGGDGNAAPLPDTMKLTVLGQYGKGLVQCEAVLGEQIQDQIERLKW